MGPGGFGWDVCAPRTGILLFLVNRVQDGRGDVRAKIILGDAHAKVGLLQIMLGKSTDEGGLLKSLEIRRQLLATNPNNGGRKEALANSCEMLGDAEVSLASRARLTRNVRTQDWRNARSHYQQALSLYLELQSKGALRGEDARVRRGPAGKHSLQELGMEVI